MEKELSIKQKAAAEFMVSNPELGYDEVAAKLGINPATLWRWRKREDFQQYSHELCMERFKDLERLAIRKLHENVTKNNQKAIEYALDYIGYKASEKVDITSGDIVVNITGDD